jgi:hypothetical protein
MKNILFLCAAIAAVSAFGMEKEQPSKRQRASGVEHSAEEDAMKDIASLIISLNRAYLPDDINKTIEPFVSKMVEYSKYFNTPFPAAVVNDESLYYAPSVICKQGESFFIYFLRLLSYRSFQHYIDFAGFQQINPAFIACLKKEKVTSVLQSFFIDAIQQADYTFMRILLTLDKDLLDASIDGKTSFVALKERIARDEKTIKMNSKLRLLKKLLEQHKAALKSLQDVFKEREQEKQEKKKEMAREFNMIQLDRIKARMDRVNPDDAINFMVSLQRK